MASKGTVRHRHGGGRLVRPATAVLVVLGFLLQGLLPGLDLAFRGDFARGAFAVEPAMCHSSSVSAPARAADAKPVDEDGPVAGHECCLVCQTVGLTDSVPPSPTFKVPTAGTAGLSRPGRETTPIIRQAFRNALARAPPLDVA